MDLVRSLAASFVIVSSAAVFPPTLLAADDASELWVAQSRGISQLEGANGEITLEISSAAVRAVAVDTSRGMVWALVQQTLLAYDRDGAFLFSVPVSGPSGQPAFLEVDPESGTLWLGLHSQVIALDPSGAILSQRRLPNALSAAALDTTRGHFWYASSDTLEAVDAAGIVTRNVQLDGTKLVTALAYAAGTDRIWVTADDSLRRVSAADGEVAIVAQARLFGELTGLAADDAGGVWGIDRRSLVRINGSGGIELTLHPFDGESPDQLVGLVAEAGGQAWVATARSVARIGLDGHVALRAALDHPDGKTRNIASIALAGGFAPARIEFVSPGDGARLNASRPEFRLAFSGDLDPNSIRLYANEVLLAAVCTIDAPQATCVPSVDMSDGTHLVVAEVSTAAGSTSSAPIEITIDTRAPNLTVTNPENDFLTNVATLTVTGNVDESASVAVNGAAATMSGQQFSFGPVTLSEGTNEIEVVATDLAGNVAANLLVGILDTVPPPAPSAGLIQLTTTAGQVQVAGGAGSVEANASVVITNLATGTSETAVADASGAFAASISGNAGEEIRIHAVDAAGNVGSPITLAVPDDGGGGGHTETRFAGPIEILATSPANGSSVAGSSVLVAVDLQAPPNTGVVVNDVVATPVTAGGDLRFYAQVPLVAGANTIQIFVYGQDGREVTRTIEVTSTARDAFGITARPGVGVTPLQVGFSVADHQQLGIWDIEVDFTSDGVVDLITAGDDPIEHTYTGTGVVHAEFWVFDDWGTGHRQRVPIVLLDPAVTDTSLQAIWGAMNDALVAGDVQAAMQYLTGNAQDDYGPVFDALLEHMPEIVASYSALHPSFAANGYAEGGVMRTINGVQRVFIVSFVQDHLGRWMIDSM